MKTGEYIEQVIAQKGVTKIQLCADLEYNRSTFNNKIRDDSFTVSEYIRLCKYLSVPPEQYFKLYIKIDTAEGAKELLVPYESKILHKKVEKSETQIITELLRQNAELIGIVKKLTGGID